MRCGDILTFRMIWLPGWLSLKSKVHWDIHNLRTFYISLFTYEDYIIKNIVLLEFISNSIIVCLLLDII